MSKWVKRVLSVLLVCLLIGGAATANVAAEVANQWYVLTVLYDLNGGSGASFDGWISLFESGTASFIVGSQYVAAPTKNGYEFQGWKFKDNNPTSTLYSHGQTLLNFYVGKKNSDVTLIFVAQWKGSSHTVNFNANGGSVSPSSKSVTNGSTYGTLPTPTRSGYTFNGWYTATSGGSKVTSSSTVNLNGNQTLYARWVNPGTTLTVLSTVDCGYTVTVPANYTLDCYAKPTDTSRTTYISAKSTSYAVWCTKRLNMSDGSTRYFFRSGDDKDLYFKFTNSMSVVTNHVFSSQLYYESDHPHNAYYLCSCGQKSYQEVHWLTKLKSGCPQCFPTLTLNANGGSVTPTSVNQVTGSSYLLPTPTRSGYTFTGWTLTSGGGTLYNNNLYYIFGGSSGTVTAQWVVNPTNYTLTLNANGGTVTPTSTSQAQGTTYTLPTPTRSGYTFTGWTLSGGGSLSGNVYTFGSSNGTVTAGWSANVTNYTLTLNANGGNVSPASVTQAQGSTYTLPTPSRSGYTFTRWTLSGGGSLNRNVYTFGSSNGTVMAEWTADATNYTLTYHANGGSGAPAPQTVPANTNFNLSSTVPVRNRYTFLGWATIASGTDKLFQPNQSVYTSGDVTLYAMWQANPPKTIFSTNYQSNLINWLLFIVFFGWIWMWFV